MISRPKNTDTMDDIYKMQEDFMKEKSKQNFVPAAKFVKVNNSLKTGKKPKSLFAQQRNLKQSKSQEENKIDSNEIIVIKDVIERKYDMMMDIDDHISEEVEITAFPKPINIKLDTDVDESSERSLFSQTIHSSQPKPSTLAETNLTNIFKTIDEENTKFLQSMSKEQILGEREKLLNTLDPKLIDFLRKKRKNTTQDDFPIKNKPKPQKFSFDETIINEDLPALDILKDENASNWLNMNLVEPEKLEWTKNIENLTRDSLKAGAKFEARFDWKGFLLPYIFEEENSKKDDRDLFMHGDEPDRPGYTLQELFRLARSNVLQQRTSALTAIAGILNIYNQGYYDEILQLPISKIFFFLRFSVDENVPSIIQAALKGLSVLFYNETDETLLDGINESASGFYQPLMRQKPLKDTLEENNFESAFENLHLNEDNNLINCDIDDDVEVSDENNLNDFHLAETNLVECLLRTNIIERITYILTSIETNQIIIEYCIKILIRIARDSEQNALIILNKLNLMKYLAQIYLPNLENLESSYLIIKLFRIIGSYNISFLKAIQNYEVLDCIISYIAIKDDLNMKLIKLQIECFRFLRLYFFIIPDEMKYNELLMPMRYLIEWHYQFLQFTSSNHFIIRTHASALLHLLGRSNITVSFTIFGEIFKMCCSKWFHIAQREGVTEFSQKILLSSLLDVVCSFIKFGHEFFYDFLNDYFIKFMNSIHYKRIEDALTSSSLFFKNEKDRRCVHKPLFNLGTVICRKLNTLPHLILSQEYSTYFMQSILIFINSFNNQINVKNLEYYNHLKTLFYTNGGIDKYMTEFSLLKKRYPLSSNWFAIIEVEFIFNLLKTKFNEECSWLFNAAYNLLQFLSINQHPLALEIFEKFIFNTKFYNTNLRKEEDFDYWKFIFNGVVMSKVKETQKKYLAVIDEWNEALLSNTWTYTLLLFLLYKVDVTSSSKKIVEINLKEEDIIKTTLKFNKLLSEKNINRLSQDNILMHLMLIYFGEDRNFLDADIKELIKEELNLLKKGSFNFNTKLNGEKSFENLYMMFLDTFQANGYGDNLFSSIVMIPLVQKYDVKWRKLIWSEYAMDLKFIKCTEADLLVDLKEYLYPIESDESLIKSYKRALQTNQLCEKSIPWIIANHHVKYFSSSNKKTSTTEEFMKIDDN
ncbi:hypothetical protein PVAND_004251 [Polypedilum vanderplanki]|uniref:RNA polymerase II-associated protein 1 n=1 Tax=Polypedilum vanderplanki TaxID=319348 RepID=A0A9J6BWJ8_POLVA|nr:hypothetical protein PVAND_004251 [Polypedilum vanderplanki]